MEPKSRETILATAEQIADAVTKCYSEWIHRSELETWLVADYAMCMKIAMMYVNGALIASLVHNLGVEHDAAQVREVVRTTLKPTLWSVTQSLQHAASEKAEAYGQ